MNVEPRSDSTIRCAYCHEGMPEEDYECPECGTRLHAQCSVQCKECPTLGCGASLPPPEKKGRARRLLALASGAALLLATALGVYALLKKEEEPRAFGEISEKELERLMTFEEGPVLSFQAVPATVHSGTGTTLRDHAWRSPQGVSAAGIRTSRLGAESLLVLKEDGVVLRFDPTSLKPTHQLELGPGDRPVCLDAGPKGAAFVALADGQILQISPNGDCLLVAKLTGKPIALAPSRGPGALEGVLVVAESEKGLLLYRLRTSGEGSTWAHLTYSRWTQANLMGRPPTEFLLDSSGRLWLGADRGEWGGWMAVVSLAKGTVHEMSFVDGVYGFTELADGRVLAYGGMSHLGMNTSYLARVDRLKVESLYEGFRSDWKAQEENPAPPGPGFPITHVVEAGDEILVFSYGQVFRTDASFSDWELVEERELQYRSGRPDAMGAYPAIRAVHGVPGTKRVLITTVLDGVQSVDPK